MTFMYLRHWNAPTGELTLTIRDSDIYGEGRTLLERHSGWLRFTWAAARKAEITKKGSVGRKRTMNGSAVDIGSA